MLSKIFFSLHRIMAGYKNGFNAMADSAQLVITKQKDMETYFLELAGTNLAKSNRKNLAGVTFNKFGNGTIIAWFNGQPFHAAPLALNLVNNAIVKAMLGSDHGIQLYNHPMTNGAKKNEIQAVKINTSGAIVFAYLGLMLTLISANYIMSYIRVNLNHRNRMTNEHFNLLCILI